MLNVSDRKITMALVGLWMLTIGLGVASHAHHAANQEPAPAGWTIKHRPTLALFLTLDDPRSEETIDTLEHLAPKFPNCEIKTYVATKDETFDWTQTNFWKRSANIPKTKTLIDKNSHFANLYRANPPIAIVLDEQGHRLHTGTLDDSFTNWCGASRSEANAERTK